MRKLLVSKRILLPVLLVLVLVLGLMVYSKTRPKPGIYLTGPVTHIKLGQTYTYTVKIVSDTSYDEATINFFVPPSGYRASKNIRLKAHHAWQGTFPVVFTSINKMSKDGLEIAVLAFPPHAVSKTLFNKIYTVQPLPHQNVYVPTKPVKFNPPSYFGS